MPLPPTSRRCLVVVATACLVAAGGCKAPPRWQVSDDPNLEDAKRMLSPHGSSALGRELRPSEIPDVPVREKLRPCCAFGAEIGATVGPVPVPWYQIPNIVGPDDPGPHVYDSGIVRRARSDSGSSGLQVDAERNGLLYTCRGGFIDTAHVRDYVDWTLYISTQIGRHLLAGEEFSIPLPKEGGARRIVVRPVPGSVVDRVGYLRLVTWLSEWLGFHLSVWHEIVTWFGWGAVPGFSEQASSFSPEDLYSNAIGVHLSTALAYRHAGRTEPTYNRSVYKWMKQVLRLLGAVSEETALRVMRAVDGQWWDSNARVPQSELVIRRNFDFQGEIAPWLVPDSALDAELRSELDAECSEGRAPLSLHVMRRVEGIDLAQIATIEIEPGRALAKQEPFASMGPVVTVEDFPALVEFVRARVLEEFGPGSDRPE